MHRYDNILVSKLTYRLTPFSVTSCVLSFSICMSVLCFHKCCKNEISCLRLHSDSAVYYVFVDALINTVF